MAQQISTNTFGCAKWVVSADATQGTHTTIAGAITSASSGDTIFIRPGTYTENITLKAGVNLSAYVCDGLNINSSSLSSTGHIIISGKTSMTAAGYSVLSGITLQTNSDYCLSVTGSSATNVFLTECTIVGSNHNSIEFTSSSSSANIFVQYSNTTITNATYNLYDMTSPGSLSFYYCSNASAGTAASNNSAGVLTMEYVNGNTVMTTSSTGIVAVIHCDLDTGNTTTLTTAGSGTSTIRFSNFTAGSASAISVGTGTTVNAKLCSIGSTNTNAITGAGTLNYAGLIFTNTSSTINVTTQSGGTINGGKFQAPSAGFIGESISSATASAAVGLSTGTPANVTSISLTAGIWDVSGAIDFSPGAGVTNTAVKCSISTTSATDGTLANNMFQGTVAVAGTRNGFAMVPQYRITITATTTTYLVADANFSGGTLSAGGRISATRVG